MTFENPPQAAGLAPVRLGGFVRGFSSHGRATFRAFDGIGVGRLFPPREFAVHDRGAVNPCALPGTILVRACQHVWLVPGLTTCIATSHTLTIPSTLAPHCRRAGSCAVPSRFGTARMNLGYLVHGHATVRYLAAFPCRVLLVEQQVWSGVSRQTIAHATSCRTTPHGLQPGGFLAQPASWRA